jgi:8-oxo-dGTP pyrophosphatase MutT (NUDIX family)
LNNFDVFSLKDKEDFLPGMEAWLPLAPPGRFPIPHKDVVYRSSAVAIVLFPVNNTLNTLVLIRTHNEQDQHSGQISFPGGKAESSDPDTVFTALRELEEETGIVLSRDNFIGRMTRLAIPISRFEVDPILFYVDVLPEISLSQDEAKAFYILPLNTIPWHHIPTMDIHQHGVILKDIPYLTMIHNVPLWGATAMILAELEGWIQRVQNI